MVEETSAAARNLASEVGRLAEQAQRFRIVDAAAGRGAMYRAGPANRTHAAPQSRTVAAPAPVPAMAGADDGWNTF